MKKVDKLWQKLNKPKLNKPNYFAGIIFEFAFF